MEKKQSTRLSALNSFVGNDRIRLGKQWAYNARGNRGEERGDVSLGSEGLQYPRICGRRGDDVVDRRSRVTKLLKED